MEKSEIEDFYNEYSSQQTKIGLNLRHYTIFHECIKHGMKSTDKVLEIGCGVGTLTSLLFPFLKRKGLLYAADISSESIRIAQAKLGSHANLKLIVTDMSDFNENIKFDFIVLPDVLEHIPVELHKNLFKTLRNHMHDNSKIVINIPNPKIIEYYRIYSPEGLQIIDQAIYPESVTSSIEGTDLFMPVYREYSLFNTQKDYVQIILEVNKERNYSQSKSKFSIIFNKTKFRISYFFIKMGSI